MCVGWRGDREIKKSTVANKRGLREYGYSFNFLYA